MNEFVKPFEFFMRFQIYSVVIKIRNLNITMSPQGKMSDLNIRKKRLEYKRNERDITRVCKTWTE